MSRVLVVAPHPDDETLGCGGTILRHGDLGDQLAWLTMTSIDGSVGYTMEQIQARRDEVQKVADAYGFALVEHLGYPTTTLDAVPLAEIIERVAKVVREFEPEIVYLPHAGDIHSDHRVTYDACAPVTKWFRHRSVTRVLTYETLSETGQGIGRPLFAPTVFVDVTPYLGRKVEILRVYESEIGDYPFPRSEEAVRALAAVRGTAAGFEAAEAFELLLERDGA